MSTAKTGHLGYRPDIDGLRTIAVIPVVLNHMGLHGIWGGFVGVDIFFVISGFLITGNIISECRSGSYAITTFYRRRILRIYPALFAMLAVCSATAVATMLPSELLGYGRSLGAATLFGSNILFYFEAGYFEPAARLKPLLHTWSLAIEEQFYIFWPLILAPAARLWPKALPVLAGAVVAVSLAVSMWMVASNPSAAYYLLPSRAWELAIGALLATLPALRLPRWLSEGLAILALLMIAYAVHSFTEATPFPGAAAILPCGGAALLILTGGSGTLASRLLSLRPMVFLGKNSYSLYLWHWPVIVFTSIGLFQPANWRVMLGEFVASLALAVLSTRYVEGPFRKGNARWSTPVVLAWGGGAMAGSVLVAGLLIGLQGLPQRFTLAQQKVAAYAAMDGDALYRRGTCFAVGDRMAYDAAHCLAHKPGLPGILLVGDSHAAHYWPGLAQYQSRYTVMQATHTGCKPVIYPASHDPCREFFTHMLHEGILNDRPDVLLLAARWRAEDLPLLAQTLADPIVRSAHPVLVGPVPQYTSSLPRLLVYGERRHNPALAFHSRDPQVAETDRAMAALAARLDIPYISMLSLMCDDKDCLVWARPGVPMQFDYGHFTGEGSVRATDLLMREAARRGVLPAVAH